MSLILSDQPGLLGPKVEVSFLSCHVACFVEHTSAKYLMYLIYSYMKQERLYLTTFPNAEDLAENTMYGRVF